MLSLVAVTRDPKTDLRTIRGNSNSKGSVPGVIYGKKCPSTPLSLDTSDLLRVFREAGYSNIISLSLDGKKHQAIIHDVDVHPVSGQFIHVDFLAVSAHDKLTVTVPITLSGESQAAREGAIVDHVLQSIEIRCLPADIPTELTVDISKLEKVGDSLHISDLGLDLEKHEIVHHEMTDSVVIASEFQEYVPDEVPAEVEVLSEKKEGEEGDAGTSEEKSE
ncbi:50S ribosomal protein L25 [Candidatus Gracilibacteria bacterium]|nr:50S ribosomal protein L25 [Candidatus Gracilibacteria bacterium]